MILREIDLHVQQLYKRNVMEYYNDIKQMITNVR